MYRWYCLLTCFSPIVWLAVAGAQERLFLWLDTEHSNAQDAELQVLKIPIPAMPRRQAAGTVRPSILLNLCLALLNRISLHVLELSSYPSIWSGLRPPIASSSTPIHQLHFSLLPLEQHQPPSTMWCSGFPGVWSLSIQHLRRSHTSTCSVLILIRRRADVISAFLKLRSLLAFFRTVW